MEAEGTLEIVDVVEAAEIKDLLALVAEIVARLLNGDGQDQQTTLPEEA